MFRRLLKRKPRLDAAKPEDRVAALAALRDDAQDTFAQFYLTDRSVRVRLAALERLTRLEVLVDGLGDDELAEATLRRLLALIDDETPAAIRNHPLVCRKALALVETLAEALDIAVRIDKPSDRFEALAENPRADVRLAVAQATWNLGELAELEQSARGRDKSVHRVARSRLALAKEATARREREDARAEEVLGAAVSLRNDDPHYDARRAALERDWTQHLAEMEATDRELAPFGVVARDLNAARQRFPARRQAPPKAIAKPDVDFEAMLAEAETLRGATLAGAAEALTEAASRELAQTADKLASAWNAAADGQPPGDALRKRFRELMAAVAAGARSIERALALAPQAAELLRREVPEMSESESPLPALRRECRRQGEAVGRLLEHYAWPEDLAKPPDVVALEQRQRALAEAEQRCVALVAERTDEVVAGISALRDHVERGAVRDAMAGERRLRDQLKMLPHEAAQPFAGELAELGAKLRELRDWRTYAETPKREALCRQMEELATTPLAVQQQAAAVKSLRSQWNDLGAVDSHKNWELRKRFDNAAERAFEPCRVHFKEQAARRRFNFEQRQAIVDALSTFVADSDWDNTDWRGVERILRQARAEWRQYHPMDRKSGRDLAARFEKLADELHGRLKQEWNRNVERKEALVAEAQRVRESGDSATEKADAMKALQRRWKAVGTMPRRADQRLWKLFRAECDSVFKIRDTVRDQRVERQRVVAETESLIVELERRIDFDPALDRNTVADYERRILDFGPLPNDLRRRAESVLQHADRVAVDRQTANARSR